VTSWQALVDTQNRTVELLIGRMDTAYNVMLERLHRLESQAAGFDTQVQQLVTKHEFIQIVRGSTGEKFAKLEGSIMKLAEHIPNQLDALRAANDDLRGDVNFLTRRLENVESFAHDDLWESFDETDNDGEKARARQGTGLQWKWAPSGAAITTYRASGSSTRPTPSESRAAPGAGLLAKGERH